MLTDKTIKKVPEKISKDKQGYLDNLEKLSIVSLTEVLDRQKKLLDDSNLRYSPSANMYASDSYIGSKVASTVELLNHFSVDDLKMILNEGSKFDDVMKDVLDCKEINNDKEVLIASNKSLAEFNLTKEGNMLELKREIIELSQTGEQLYRSVEEKLGKVNKNSGPSNLEDILALLETAVATTEEDSESLVKVFLNGGNTDVDNFLEQFIKIRKLMHLRKVKADKMIEMVQRRISRSDLSSTNMDRVLPSHGHPMDRVMPSHGNPSHVSFYPPSINPTPYPLGPVNAMPLPAMNKSNSKFY